MVYFGCPGYPNRLSPASLAGLSRVGPALLPIARWLTGKSARTTAACIVVLFALGPGTNPVLSAEAAAPDGKGVKFFESKIRPVLVRKCYACHSRDAAKAKKLKGKLLLDSKAGVLAGGESGPALVPGKPERSLLIEAIRHESLEMPPNERLSENRSLATS